MKSLVVIPTYNEAENILALLNALETAVPESHILVVDDNSPDGTGKLVAQRSRTNEKVFLLTRQKKDGLAGAYFAGFAWALERDYEAIVQMDADHSHRPSDVPRFLDLLETHDVVFGSRYAPGGGTSGWSLLRKFISRGGNLYARALLGLPYNDLTGGFNAWRSEVLERIDVSTIYSKGYAYQIELKFRAKKQGARIAELPIHFANRRFGSSKMSGAIIFEAARAVLQLRQSPS